MSDAVPRIHIVGRRNAGKTTLVCDLVRALSARGLKVATIKHTHHNHELDTPGKDSHQHREAGAAGVGILTPHMTAAFLPSERVIDSTTSYSQFQMLFRGFDLLLVEGDLHADAPKLEVWRKECGEAPYAATEPSIQAVITDDTGLDETLCCEVWPRGNLAGLADRVEERTGG